MYNKDIIKTELITLFAKKNTALAIKAIVMNWLILIALITVNIYFVNVINTTWSLLLYVLTSFLTACSLRGLDNLTHEASHYNIFQSPKLHFTLQFLYAFPVLKTVEDYRNGHFKHHKNYRSNKKDDPDTRQNERWGVEHIEQNSSLKMVTWFYIIRVILLYYVVDNILYNVIPHILSKKSICPRLILWGLIVIFVTITGTWLSFLVAYVIPLLFWLPYIRFVTESSKHSNVNLQSKFANSRNNIGWIHQYILHPHNDGFHQLHHYAASIPFYNLKKAYKYLTVDLKVKEQLIVSKGIFQTIKQIFYA